MKKKTEEIKLTLKQMEKISQVQWMNEWMHFLLQANVCILQPTILTRCECFNRIAYSENRSYHSVTYTNYRLKLIQIKFNEELLDVNLNWSKAVYLFMHWIIVCSRIMTIQCQNENIPGRCWKLKHHFDTVFKILFDLSASF